MKRDDDNFDVPAKLKGALRRMYTPPAFGGDDARILAAARAAGQARPGRRWRWAVGMGLAAAVAVAAMIFGTRTPDSGTAAHEAIYTRTGDIRDAFYVARQLKAHRTLEARWDVNGDGIVDEEDAQALAAAAVSLSPKGTMQ